MTSIRLQPMLELLGERLPVNWSAFDLGSFSLQKSLWDYQQQALQYALRALWKYYGQPELSDDQRKQAFYQWYRDDGLEQELDIPLDASSAAKRRIAALLQAYYPTEDSHIPYQHFINRMAFWMATGSGKTLVIVKLIELLHELMQRGEIPQREILVLAHRDDLLEQLRKHVDEFNFGGGLYLRLHELREYSQTRHTQPGLFSQQERLVFYYRSDNLSDEQKEKIIDFRSFDNHGEWFILLDEAHKGDREDSKRQHIYSILSRNGFLFNFSATFTDDRDIIATAYNFNLSEYIRKGFGKHIYIFKQETGAFRRSADFSESEKQKIVLKALLMLALARRHQERLQTQHTGLYHRPLLMTLVNSVNTRDADLKLFFRELIRIAGGGVDEQAWQQARQELLRELAGQPAYLYESDEKVRIPEGELLAITQSELLRTVFNSGQPGEIEVLIRPSDRKEIAFKLKTSQEAFALIRIGDVSEWLTRELSGYEINQHFNDEGFFERLNHPSSDINLLLGSRSFYEGWDSNRPNVIVYINIGSGSDARKFILQSVGRGVRIQPLPNQRQRLRSLNTAGALSPQQTEFFHQVKQHILPLESLFIFGVNRDGLELVMDELDQAQKQVFGEQVSLRVNQEQAAGRLLLIPVYRRQPALLHQTRQQAKFGLSNQNLDLLQRYLSYLDDPRLLLALHDATPAQVAALQNSLAQPGERFSLDGPDYKNRQVLLKQAFNYFSLYGKEFEQFKPLEDEIIHFRQVRVALKDEDFIEFERRLQEFFEQNQKVQDMKARYASGQISFDEVYNLGRMEAETQGYTYQGQTVQFNHIAQHYYLPLLVSEDERLDYLRSVIQVESEVKFLRNLEAYLKKDDNRFKQLDWWLFSRVDETYDDVTIPYYDPYDNKLRNFKPDFIFWLQKGNDYHILFVDPKGTSRTEYQHKVDGYRAIFEENDQPRIFTQGGMRVQVHLALYTKDIAYAAEFYRPYWLDKIEEMLGFVEKS